jgi:hypothetical protein
VKDVARSNKAYNVTAVVQDHAPKVVIHLVTKVELAVESVAQHHVAPLRNHKFCCDDERLVRVADGPALQIGWPISPIVQLNPLGLKVAIVVGNDHDFVDY